MADEKEGLGRRALEAMGLRQDNETAVNQHSPSASIPTAETHGGLSLPDLLIGVFGALTAEPLCHAGWDAVVSGEHFDRGIVAIAAGLVVGSASGSFHWWKKRLSEGSRQAAERYVGLWVPIAAVLLFVFLVGPDVYQRATAPTPRDAEAALESRKATLTEWLKKAQAERDQAIVERDGAQSGWADEIKRTEGIQSQATAAQQERDQMRRQLADTQAQLTAARQSTPATPTAPSPPKNFYSQKQKDELADMLQAAMSLIDKENAEILPITNTFMPQIHQMGPLITIADRLDAMVTLEDKIKYYANEAGEAHQTVWVL